jgi:hypothetical protein
MSTKNNISSLKNDVYGLIECIENKLFCQMKQDMVDAQGIYALTKLIDSFLRLSNAEFSIESSEVVESTEESLREEDQELLLRFKKEMAPRAGFEPATKRLTAACSTTELPRNNN